MKSRSKARSSAAKHKHFREGDLVEIVTVDRARGGRSTDGRRPKPTRKERWRAVVTGPSVMGSGWWVLKKVDSHGFRWRTYTVPRYRDGPGKPITPRHHQ